MYHIFIGRGWAGIPATVVWGGTSRITVAPAATVDHSPMLMPGITVAPAPIQAPLSTWTLPQRVAWGEICT